MQRNQIAAVLKGMNLSPTDTILLSDLDEIGNPDVLRPHVGRGGVCQLGMHMFVNQMNCRLSYQWYAAMLSSYDAFTSCLDGIPEDELDSVFTPKKYNSGTTPSRIRMLKDHPQIPKIDGAGWHFSSLGGREGRTIKMQSNAMLEEPTFDTAFITKYVSDEPDKYDPTKHIKIDATYPRYIRQNLQRFSKYIHIGPYLADAVAEFEAEQSEL